MENNIELIDDGGCISSHDTVEEAVKDFERLCDEAFSFNSNIKVVKVEMYLK